MAACSPGLRINHVILLQTSTCCLVHDTEKLCIRCPSFILYLSLIIICGVIIIFNQSLITHKYPHATENAHAWKTLGDLSKRELIFLSKSISPASLYISKTIKMRLKNVKPSRLSFAAKKCKSYS